MNAPTRTTSELLDLINTTQLDRDALASLIAGDVVDGNDPSLWVDRYRLARERVESLYAELRAIRDAGNGAAL